MCDIDFDGYCEVWRENTRKARKEHKCSACRGKILPGDEYVEHFDIFEGDTNREKICSACNVDRIEFGNAHSVNLTPGSWEHYLRECVYDGDDGQPDDRWLPMLNRLKARQKAAA